jgi:excisionase family DNA binding protein
MTNPPKQDDIGPLLTPREVARALRVSPMTVYRLIRSRKLPALRVGNSFRIPSRALDRYLDLNVTEDEWRSS